MNKKEFIFYTLFFLISLIWGLIIQPLNLDEVWNYGFAHNLYSGLTPYKDFNMVLTPIYPFIMSLGFHIFGSSMLIMHIENAVILSILLFLLSKIIDKNSIFVMLFLFFPLSITFPSYNIFIFFILVLLIFLEKNNKSDYLIGFVLGLGLLTKQSVGLFMILPSLYYIRDIKKMIKRLIGFMIPIGIFIIYLLATDSFKEFIDLCFLGLFDFAGENHHSFNIYYLLLGLFLIVDLYILNKYKKNVLNYYCLSFIIMMIPLFDTYHTQVTLLSVLLMIFINYNIDLKINLKMLFFGIVLGISIIMINIYQHDFIYPNDIKHFEYKLLDKESINFTKEINKFIKDNKDKNIIYLNSNGYYIKLVNDIPINYLDLINMGNWGYNGSDKLFEALKNVDNPIFLVDSSELSPIKQTDKRVLNYVIDNGKKIGSIRIYDIYTLNKEG